MKLTKEQAFSLLIQGLDEPESIQYVTHCRYVGNLAGMIAGEVGADAEYATCLGYLHDIGRKIQPLNHAYAGYCHLTENGYTDYAYICLTHSFLNNDIDCTAGRLLPRECEGFTFIKEFVTNHKNTVYDEIIQLCDLLCLHSGATTLEARLADIEERKGRHAKSQYHYETVCAQKARIEAALGHSVYDFYGKLNK